ncbi:adhesion G protein-coupled receptor E2-like [Montipora capricornis]|uniref:adhesion G protein-coupled receptor E2-like n=1 Tax=Montipora capricornis TaxID=246305 RepID=UPI0035F210DD
MASRGRHTICEDVNECLEDQKLCRGTDMVCHNKVGGYQCACKNGLRLNWDNKCAPLNECDERGEHCPYASTCKETSLASHHCVCDPGFKPVKAGEKLQRCEDKNECLAGDSTCTADRCRNTVGSYTCVQCLPGFIESKYGHCVGKMTGSACHCDPETEYCRNRKCVCKRDYKRNTQGDCILPPGWRKELKHNRSAHSPIRSYVSVPVIMIGLPVCLAFTRTATTPVALTQFH